MIQAKIQEAGTLKKLLDAIKELVTDANFECNEEGIMLQAMDDSLVSLVSVNLGAPGFTHHCCDHPMLLGVNLTSLTKVLRCAKDDGICTLKAADEVDVLNLVYGAKVRFFFLLFLFLRLCGMGASRPFLIFAPFFPFPPLLSSLLLLTHLTSLPLDSDRIDEYGMKLMDIDANTLIVPETKYDARVTLPSSEFTRIVRDLSQLGESVRIEVSKQGVRFTSDGEVANGSVILQQSDWGHDDDSIPAGVGIEMNQHVSIAFSLKYLVIFFKSACFSGK
ncbi:hypothetical protein CVT25_004668, partial [Psilocybe cyanescens]